MDNLAVLLFSSWAPPQLARSKAKSIKISLCKKSGVRFCSQFCSPFCNPLFLKQQSRNNLNRFALQYANMVPLVLQNRLLTTPFCTRHGAFLNWCNQNWPPRRSHAPENPAQQHVFCFMFFKKVVKRAAALALQNAFIVWTLLQIAFLDTNIAILTVHVCVWSSERHYYCKLTCNCFSPLPPL